MNWSCQEPSTPAEEIWLALQVSEDTCAKHGVFLCTECLHLNDDMERWLWFPDKED